LIRRFLAWIAEQKRIAQQQKADEAELVSSIHELEREVYDG
jgi:hypothetical protein